MGKQRQPIGRDCPGRKWWLLAAVTGYIAVASLAQHVAANRQAPNPREQIVATLVSWGLFGDRTPLLADQGQTDRHIAMLASDVAEQRVSASHWLAGRGVRAAGAAIAASMKDPGTSRPCQLAHDLGRLGDDRWVDLLVEAMRQPGNADLRVCATLALGEVASPKAVGALIEAHRRGLAGPSAIAALGKIADPAALPLLHNIAKRSPSKFERRAAAEAIDRIRVLQGPDPAGELIGRVTDSARQGALDTWATRKLIPLQDPRTVPALRQVLAGSRALREADRIVLAAALLAHGPPGTDALRQIASRPTSAASLARAALSLRAPEPKPVR